MNIVITGASRGIGLALAKAFALNPDNRIIIIARTGDALNQLASDYTNIIPIATDLSVQDTEVVSKAISAYFTHIDILINNAGQIINKAFLKITQQDWSDILYINTVAPAMLIKNVYPLMGNKHHTHIINIGSMGGFQGSSKFNGLSAYSASKAALANLTECLAEEFKGHNISVNCLALGSVQTEMLENAFPGYKANLMPEDLARFIVEFAQTGHRFFNGKILPLSISTP